ncbi:MAG: GNVR domain-containing protein, partial [Desulfuromonadaceae bacterium]|nr:GNVR domain-containing protein [Desulfuromonadaceae bacterium]
MREFKIQEALVELLTKQYEMTKLTEAKDLSPFQLLQAARVPELKSKPKRSLIVIMAAFASGFLMVLVAFVREFGANMNDEDRTRWQELKRMLPLPRRFRLK